jgi:hypothetical protein
MWMRALERPQFTILCSVWAETMTFYPTLCTGIFIGFFLGVIFAMLIKYDLIFTKDNPWRELYKMTRKAKTHHRE